MRRQFGFDKPMSSQVVGSIRILLVEIARAGVLRVRCHRSALAGKNRAHARPALAENSELGQQRGNSGSACRPAAGGVAPPLSWLRSPMRCSRRKRTQGPSLAVSVTGHLRKCVGRESSARLLQQLRRHRQIMPGTFDIGVTHVG
jgi:hypothetical protein